MSKIKQLCSDIHEDFKSLVKHEYTCSSILKLKSYISMSSENYSIYLVGIGLEMIVCILSVNDDGSVEIIDTKEHRNTWAYNSVSIITDATNKGESFFACNISTSENVFISSTSNINMKLSCPAVVKIDNEKIDKFTKVRIPYSTICM